MSTIALKNLSFSFLNFGFSFFLQNNYMVEYWVYLSMPVIASNCKNYFYEQILSREYIFHIQFQWLGWMWDLILVMGMSIVNDQVHLMGILGKTTLAVHSCSLLLLFHISLKQLRCACTIYRFILLFVCKYSISLTMFLKARLLYAWLVNFCVFFH